tara:strand:+ start:342 stop:956 length:615 start_codon:yes stop_codon:yes gene_type:complete
MNIIVITGPSGSGKSYLSKKLSKLFNNSIIIKTDSYYRDNLLIRVLSILLFDIYDRLLSIKKDQINKTLKSIKNRDNLITLYKYDFKRKYSSQTKKIMKYNEKNQILIIEGIFAHRLDVNYQESINIECKEKKEICFRRRLNRDKLERGRDDKDVIKKFDKSWYLFYKHVKNFINHNQVFQINPLDKNSVNKIVLYLESQKKNN